MKDGGERRTEDGHMLHENEEVLKAKDEKSLLRVTGMTKVVRHGVVVRNVAFRTYFTRENVVLLGNFIKVFGRGNGAQAD